MAYVWRDRKLMFFAAPATGSTAFIQHLMNHGVGQYIPNENIDKDGRRFVPRKHSTIEELRKGGVWEPEFDSYTKAVGIRNPFSFHVAKYNRNRTKRAAQIKKKNSWIGRMPEISKTSYVKHIEKSLKQSFAEYLRDELRSEPFELQAHFHVEIDVFLHQETLSEDSERLFTRIGADIPFQIADYNVTGPIRSPMEYKSYYTPDLVDLVYRMNQPFFERFPEYSFDGLAEP